MALIQTVKPDRKNRTVVFVAFESEFAPLGGLAAVMRILPRQMARFEENDCFTLTPFFKNIIRCKSKRFAEIENTREQVTVRFGSAYHTCTIYRHVDKNGFKTYLLDADDFFNAPCDCGNPPAPNAPCNPYFHPDDPGQLLRDALFFCAAVPKVLVALGKTENLFVSLQDWQTACAALTIKKEPAILSTACTLTIHNPYDQPITDEEMTNIFRRTLPGPTVLTKTMQFIDGPICTVSENFANELVQGALHPRVYAPHLQPSFHERGIVGIDNGLFAQLDFPAEAIEAARSGDLHPILKEKRRRREALVQVLETYRPAAAWGTIEDLDTFEGPIFLFFGRDDPRQKGYDVATAAIRRIPPGNAKYIFTPVPGLEGLEGLGFLKRLTQERPGEVKVFPFRLQQGYMELQRGSSFLGMCSLYEPFGGATEGYAVGTPVVARATGGLVQQIAPYPGGSLSRSVRWRTDRFHARNAPPTGILFREPDMPEEEAAAEWRQIVDCAYWPDGDRLADREGNTLFDTIVREAAWALDDAINLYTERPLAYAQMIASGFAMLEQFTWERAVRGYQRIYDLVGR